MIQTPEGYLGKTVMNGRYVYRYRYAMEQKLNRFLKDGELVHHITDLKILKFIQEQSISIFIE